MKADPEATNRYKKVWNSVPTSEMGREMELPCKILDDCLKLKAAPIFLRRDLWWRVSLSRKSRKFALYSVTESLDETYKTSP